MGKINKFDWKIGIGKYIFILFSGEDRKIVFDLQMEINSLTNEPVGVQKFGDNIGLEFFWDQCLNCDKIAAFLEAAYRQHKNKINKIIFSKTKSKVLVRHRGMETEVMPIILLTDDGEGEEWKKKKEK
jgi:hypothetical protein